MRDSYNYKQVTIPKGMRKEGETLFTRYQKTVKDVVMPLIAELENRCLLRGFYIMNHAGIDIRLSAKDWFYDEKWIKNILQRHGIYEDLVDYEYKGADLNELTPVMDKFLRFNTKLLFDYLKIKDEGFEETLSSGWIPYRPAQYMHFMFNQWGYQNIEEALLYDYYSHAQIKIAYYQTGMISAKYMRKLYKSNMKLNAWKYFNRLKIDTKGKIKRWLKRK